MCIKPRACGDSAEKNKKFDPYLFHLLEEGAQSSPSQRFCNSSIFELLPLVTCPRRLKLAQGAKKTGTHGHLDFSGKEMTGINFFEVLI